MKKTWCAMLALMMILTMLCTACSKSGDDAAAETDPTAAPATDLPTVTAPPAAGEEDSQITGLAADDNSAPQGMDREAWLATLSEDQRKAEELTGHTVEELYEAIGEPKGSEYTASCLVEGGEDGILAYDGFYVSTTRFTNGVEYVMGTSN